MTPNDLEAISLVLWPGANRTNRAKHIATIVEREHRAILYWFSGKTIVPHWAEEKLLLEHQKVLRLAAKKDAN